MNDFHLYIVSFYFTVTTITTVGYGDIATENVTEDIVAVIIMISGVIAFSFLSGSLTSILANYDQSEALLKEKVGTLNEIHSHYGLSAKLYDEIRRIIRCDYSKRM